MAIELDHDFVTAKPIDQTFATILDLERVVPCVEGGSVLERTGPDSVRAQIEITMGVMTLTFAGTVEVAERDVDAHRVLLAVRSTEASGQGDANADVEFTLSDGGGTIHTNAQITGIATSNGEGIAAEVLAAMIDDFIAKFVEL